MEITIFVFKLYNKLNNRCSVNKMQTTHYLFGCRFENKFQHCEDEETVFILTVHMRPMTGECFLHLAQVLHEQTRLKGWKAPQSEAYKIILGQSCSECPEALCTLGLCTLAERRAQLCLNFARKLLKSSFSVWLTFSRGSSQVVRQET